LAYATTTHTFSVPSAPFSQKDDDFQVGWTAGGGVELLRDSRWLLRAEALYVDLGDETHSYTFTGCGGTCGGRTRWEDSFWVARVGLSYKLGEPERIVPLK
jgi:outer membrane immunogenic protein